MRTITRNPFGLMATPAVDNASERDEQRITALAGAIYLANTTHAEALKTTDPAATLDNICDALPDVFPKVLGILNTTPEMAEVLKAAVVDRLWAYTVVEHARANADDGYGYVFDLLAEALRKGADPAVVRADAQRATECLSGFAGGAR